MKKNVQLLKDTLGFIEQNTDAWDQTSFRQCFAAHAAQLAGAQFLVEYGRYLDENYWQVTAPTFGHTMPVWEYAEKALGLTRDEADDLFRGGNQLEDLQDIVAALIDEQNKADIQEFERTQQARPSFHTARELAELANLG